MSVRFTALVCEQRLTVTILCAAKYHLQPQNLCVNTAAHSVCVNPCVHVCVWPLTSCVLTGFVTGCGLEWHRYFYHRALRMQVCVFCLSVSLSLSSSVCLSAEAFSHSRYCNRCYSRESWRSLRKLCRPLSLTVWQTRRAFSIRRRIFIWSHIIQWTTSWDWYS